MKKTMSGARKTIGRPLRYKETTKRLYFSVPKSKVSIFQKEVGKILASFIK